MAALEINLTAREQDVRTRKQSDNPQAYDAFLQGWESLQQFTPLSIAAAVPYLERALELDPDYSRAHAALAAAYLGAWRNRWVKQLGLSYLGTMRKAKHHLELALVHPTPLAHQTAAKLAIAQHRPEDAVAESERATALLYLASAHGHLGQKKQAENVIESFNQLRQSQDLSSFNQGIIDHWPVGGTAERERLGAGLTDVEPWRHLVSREAGRFVVKGAKRIDTQTAKFLHDRNVVFIDIRSDRNWRQEDHIPGAIHLNRQSKLNRASLSALVAKDREIVFYCANNTNFCTFSAQATAMAVSWGFTSVYFFAEGMNGWRRAGFPVERP